MSKTPTFLDHMTVELVKESASDLDVLHAAWVSTKGDRAGHTATATSANRKAGLINMLMRDRHGSPFEHSSFTFYVHTTIFTWREIMRHRIASYNEESGRYKQLEPVFYLPATNRNLVQEGKPGAYVFKPGSEVQHARVAEETKHVSITAYSAYERMLEDGIAREVARIVLPLNIYSSAYVTMNARALMNFLSLRTKSEDSTYPSFPQREIEMVAEQMEEEFQRLMPDTHAAFVKNGRVAP